MPDVMEIYWDTSFIISYMNAPDTVNITKQQRCDAFAQHLLHNKSCDYTNLTSDFAINEALYHHIVMAAEARLNSKTEKGYASQHELHKWLSSDDGRTLVRSLKHNLEDFLEEITTYLGIIRCEREYDLSSDALAIISQHGILPTDAYQLAIARNHDITNFVSLDKHFRCMDGCTVYCYRQ